MTTQLYSIRPGRRSDVSRARDLYLAAFGGEQLLEILFPGHTRHPEALATHLHRLFVHRWWSFEYVLAVCVPAEAADDDVPGAAVGCTWWKRPASQISFYERWLSPCMSPFPHSPLPALRN